jgi:hypothetical protein
LFRLDDLEERKMNQMTRIVAAGSVVLAAASLAQAAVIAADSYPIGANPAAGEYVINTSLGNAPAGLVTTGFVTGPYSGGSGTSNFITTDTGLANSVAQATAATGKVNWISAPIDANVRSRARNLTQPVASSDTYWISHLVNRGDIPQAGGNGFVLTGFGNATVPAAGATSGTLAGLFVGFAQDGVAGNFGNLVIRHRAAASNTSADIKVLDGATTNTFGTTYHVVMKLDVNVGGGSGDQLTWWLNPADGSSEAALNATSAATGTAASFALAVPGDFVRLNYTAFQWNGSAFFDEPRLASSLAGLALVPEPASLSLLALGGMAMLRRRRA